MDVIVGAGAVGGVLAALLARAGTDVAFLVGPGRVAHYRAQSRLVLEYANGRPPLDLPAPPVLAQLPPTGLTWVYLAIKHPALDAVLGMLKRDLPRGVPIVTCLNGVGVAARLRREFPENPVYTMTVMFNAMRPGTLRFVLTTYPAVLVDGDDGSYLDSLRAAGFKVGRGDEAIAWGKLLINLNNAIGALTHATFKDILYEPALRAVFVLTLDEAVRVLRVAGIAYTLPMPLPYGAYRLLMRHGGPLPWWLARRVNGLSDTARPSMAADLDAGRPTEVEALNGAISAFGRTTGVPTPLNDALVRLVRECDGAPPARYRTPAELLALLRATGVT